MNPLNKERKWQTKNEKNNVALKTTLQTRQEKTNKIKNER